MILTIVSHYLEVIIRTPITFDRFRQVWGVYSLDYVGLNIFRVFLVTGL